MAMMKPNKIRWDELVEDEEIDLGFLLPPPQVIGPDSNGIKKVITYKLNGEGKTVKVTTTSRVHKLATTRVVQIVDQSFVQGWPVVGFESDDEVASGAILRRRQGLVIRRVTIGWPCVLTRILHPNLKVKRIDPVHQMPPRYLRNTYVPPSKRLGAERSTGTDMRRNDDDNAVRVRNLSEDTCDADLKDLFGSFGPVVRAHVVKDYKTGLSRGYDFVNFVSREDAQRAINNLNGYGYDNIILDVQCPAPRAN
ncbi:hypothetical protein RJ639_031936 [Escallonia herrerae]|uniref:RRM domain-containing protein n=1 Tax=Escallonia herrerae TaxID=1293975 RepID=A0AA89BI75_9ASTE|nr:hypothetical protein RJ639_031936 [Escallonia herrerae]